MFSKAIISESASTLLNTLAGYEVFSATPEQNAEVNDKFFGPGLRLSPTHTPDAAVDRGISGPNF